MLAARPPAIHVRAIVDTVLDVGAGQRLHFRIAREGAPIVVLDAGGGLDASQWNAIQDRLARAAHATVVSYDRAGFGGSSLPATPYDVHQEVAWLLAGLDALRLTGPFVYVAHSYAGLLSLALAMDAPTRVGAFVLADPTTVQFIDSAGGPENAMFTPRFPADVELPPILRAAKRQIAGLSSTVGALRSSVFPANVPLVVITSDTPPWPTPQANVAWRAAHEALVRASPATAVRALVFAPGSRHDIPRERPDLIISIVVGVLALVR